MKLETHAIDFASPHPIAVIANDCPRFTIVAVTDAYLQAAGASRDDLIGRPLFDAFPEAEAGSSAVTGASQLRSSLERVLATAKPDVMPVYRYDIPRRGGVVRELEERHWAPYNAPVMDATRTSVSHVIHRADDLTALARRERARGAHARGVHLQLETTEDVGPLREALRRVADGCGLDGARSIDLLVVASELARNMVVHGSGGTVDVRPMRSPSRDGVRVVFHDGGSRASKLELALRGGYGALGRALGGSRRLIDELHIESGRSGTSVSITKWRQR